MLPHRCTQLNAREERVRRLESRNDPHKLPTGRKAACRFYFVISLAPQIESDIPPYANPRMGRTPRVQKS